VTGERYVLLGLARPRAAWFRQVGQWATSAALPADVAEWTAAGGLRQPRYRGLRDDKPPAEVTRERPGA
jgi:bifunctional non-homologous end joining protein LigD